MTMRLQRPPRPPVESIFHGRATSESSSGSSPDRILDDDQDTLMSINDDSQTSIGDLTSFRDMTVSPSIKPARPLSPVHHLPPELLMAIFSKLSSPLDLRRCMLVSKQWSNCSVELLWQRPYITRFDSFEIMIKALLAESAFFSYPQLIRRLNLNFIADLVNDGSMEPMTRCTRLERLTLTNCKQLTDSPLMKILERNPRIQAVDFSLLENITDNTMMALADNCPRLQGLNLAGCKNVTDLSLVPLSMNRSILKRVSATGSPCEWPR